MKHPISLQVLPQSSYRHLSNYRCDSSATHISVFRGKTQPTAELLLSLSQRHYRPWQNLERSLFPGLHQHHRSRPKHHSEGDKTQNWEGNGNREWKSKTIIQGKMTTLSIPALLLTRKAYSGPSTIFSWISCFAFEDGFKIWLVGGWASKEPFSLHWQRWMLLTLNNSKKDTEAHSPKNPHPSWLSTNCHFETHSLSSGREEAQFSSQHCTEVKGQVSGANFSLSTQPTTKNNARVTAGHYSLRLCLRCRLGTKSNFH